MSSIVAQNPPQYYDPTLKRMIDLESDGCEFSEWEQLSGERLFARHPDGFKIFLKHDRITDSDEYAESDPYKVEESIDGAFHSRRFELTIEMIKSVVASGTKQPRILDIGCGEGHITEEIRLKIPGSNVTGLDYSVSAIKYMATSMSLCVTTFGSMFLIPCTC